MAGNRRNNKNDMTICEQLESIKECMCEGYCYYRRVLAEESEEVLDKICHTCPMTEI